MQHPPPGSDPTGDLSHGSLSPGPLGPGPLDPRVQESKPGDGMQERLRRWQTVRSWARLIREAESLWHVDARLLHRLALQQ